MEAVVLVDAVFEGGGIRGVALAGAAAGAMDAGYRFERTVGTSAGALVASLVASGFDSADLAVAARRISWPDLLHPLAMTRIPLVGRHLALLTRRGMYDSRSFERVWGELLEVRGARTFGDLAPGSLRVVATDLTNSRGVLLPDDLQEYGYDPDRFPVARALRMSAAIPFVFTPVRLRDRRTGRVVWMADGAMAANYPAMTINHFVRPVLGFRLEPDDLTADEIRVRGPLSLVRSVVRAGIRARYTLPRPDEVGVSVVSVPVRNDVDFSMSPDEAQAVFERARAAVRSQLGSETSLAA